MEQDDEEEEGMIKEEDEAYYSKGHHHGRSHSSRRYKYARRDSDREDELGYDEERRKKRVSWFGMEDRCMLHHLI